MSYRKSIQRHWVKLLLLAVIIVAGCWWLHSHRVEWSREAVVSYGKGLSPVWFIITFLVLPLLGFPISVMLVLAGVRFGFWGGMALAAVGVFFHHIAAFRIVHGLFRQRLRDRIERAGYRIPELKKQNQVWFTALFAAIHGPPYSVKLYLLALTEIPLTIYLWAGAPVYIVFCAITVGAGSAAFTLRPIWIYLLVGGMIALSLVGRWLSKRYDVKSSD